MRRRSARRPSAWLLAVVLSGAAACAAPAAGRPELRVLAAASLAGVFERLAPEFERRHRVRVVFGFGGSPALARQLAAGAPGDVLAVADPRSAAAASGRLGSTVVFARNRPALLVPPGNPAGIRSLRDLDRPDVRYAACAAEVPCGRLAASLLATAGVRRSPASREPDARGVTARLALGEVDAGIGYATDAVGAPARVTAVPVPLPADLATDYGVAVVRRAHPTAAAWVALLTSATGRAALRAAGFRLP